MCLFEIFWKSILIPKQFSQPFSTLQLVKSYPLKYMYLQPEKGALLGGASLYSLL